ncbi:type II toxin-antitoxin system RelE/ParE family toxin [Endozoicomonas sp.]|uniref:type II toxin-antitoxin system RelE/ParE family toxin n=1 Tax=Endozoicomonas sp. TaxID=1892382 RepID=UPI00288760F4|nr:type II toxin-antitoxin system RelE/ParE family toxin [Endozoicomonas sp.]
MIKTFRHKGLRQFFESGTTRGIQAAQKRKLQLILTTLNAAGDVQDMSAPAFKLHELKGVELGVWSVWVNGNWRITFRFEKGDAYIVDYRDYH